jgi:hypothetical protein
MTVERPAFLSAVFHGSRYGICFTLEVRSRLPHGKDKYCSMHSSAETGCIPPGALQPAYTPPPIPQTSYLPLSGWQGGGGGGGGGGGKATPMY